MSLLIRNNVKDRGPPGQAMIFAHGFGCDQNMWRFVAPAFEQEFRTVLFDHIGAGSSDLSAYSFDAYSNLDRYAEDLIGIARELGLEKAIFVGHSVSAMIGILASLKEPAIFEKLVLVCPSPRYLHDDGYVGGFSETQIGELLEFLGDNHLGWSAALAPAIMGNPHRPELGQELTNSFCRTDPNIARQFAEVTFMSDNRRDLSRVTAPTLILQCSEDIIAPQAVGEFVHGQIPKSELVILDATGHCPNLSAPDEVIAAIRAFI